MGERFPIKLSTDVLGPFRYMMRHGAGDRAGSTVVLSRLPVGRSQISARAPSIKFVLQGDETYSIAGRNYLVRKGEFILVESGIDFGVRTADGSIGLCIYLPGHPVETSEVASDLGAPVIGGTRVDPFSEVLMRYASEMAVNPDIATRLAPELLAQAQAGSMAFLTRFASNRSHLKQAKPATRTEIFQRLERARAFIHDNVDRKLTLDELAREAALSRFHLAHTFCEAYGRGPLAYHRSLRLRDAAAKLAQGLASATDLAIELEYAFPSAFSRAFKAEFGVPPSAIQPGSLPLRRTLP